MSRHAAALDTNLSSTTDSKRTWLPVTNLKQIKSIDFLSYVYTIDEHCLDRSIYVRIYIIWVIKYDLVI